MGALHATASGVDELQDVITGVEARLTDDTSIGMSLADGLFLGAPLMDPRFLADSTCSVHRRETRTLDRSRDGWATLDDVLEISFCWSVSAATPAARRVLLADAHRKAQRLTECLLTNDGQGERYPERWAPRIETETQRLVLWADGHAEFCVITLTALYRRQAWRGY